MLLTCRVRGRLTNTLLDRHPRPSTNIPLRPHKHGPNQSFVLFFSQTRPFCSNFSFMTGSGKFCLQNGSVISYVNIY